MSVRFVIGRAGTGKSCRCFDAIVASMRADPLGPAIYWLLPKQATFQAERELTTLGGLSAFSRARVLSFELLGEEVLAVCGGAAVPAISALGRQMLIGHLLRSKQDELTFFRGVARQPGLAARLDSTFAEFERCGKDPAALAEVIDQLGDDREPPSRASSAGATAPRDASRARRDSSDDYTESDLLRRKLSDFHRLFKAYRDTLGDERVDPHRRLEQVLSCIADHAPLRGATVYIDEFLEFTERERRMIVALAQSAAAVEITWLIDPQSKTVADVHHLPDDLSLFHRTESQYRLLVLALREAGVVLEPLVQLRETKRFTDNAMRTIERSLMRDDAPTAPPPDLLELVEAPDRRTEVDAVARRIRATLRIGRRFRDMAVLVRDIDQYEELINASFREHEIPYFVDRRKPASHHPLIQLTRAAFQIARQSWPHDAVMTLLRTGLAGVGADEVDRLENYVLLHRLRGAAAWTATESWTYGRSLTRGREDSELREDERSESAGIDATRRRLVERFAPFVAIFRGVKEPTVREVVGALFKLYRRLDVVNTIGGWIDEAAAANDPEQRGEHEQVWAELAKLFDEMVDLLGDQRVAMADFVEILDVGLEQFDLALPPPRVDQVLVGQVDRTRTPALDTVFLMGLSEGHFPKIAREDSVLSDGERRSLRARNLDIDPDSERKQLDENLLGYLAFTRASRRMVVTRPAAEENKPTNPSSFWRRLTELFSGLTITRERRESEAAPEAIGTPRQLVTALMRWARNDKPAADAQQPWARLYQFLAEHKTSEDAIGVMRFKAWRAVGYHNDARLSRETALRLVLGPLKASVTRIETFAACPFKHFARYGLGLSVREEEDVTAMDLGNVYHNILERIVARMLRERTDWCEIEPQVTREMIAQFADEVGRTLRGELMLSTARNQYLLDRIERTLERVCATQKAVLSRGDFRPAFAELSFGFDKSTLPALRIDTPRGHAVLLSGKIDRVDRVHEGGEVAVIDYKTSDNKLDLGSVYHGLSLQLLTYLLVLQAGGQTLFDRAVTPVAAFYAKLLRNLKSIEHPEDAMEAEDPLFPLQTKPRGIFNQQFLRRLDASLETGASEVVQCRINKDGKIGSPNASDAADADAFAALLKFVEKRIAELADRLIEGEIGVRPYRIGTETPCSTCDYRSVCRFDPRINRYLNLSSMKRADVLAAVAEGGRDGR
ncbi:MAG: PD-(D/E)XK nuclease family protein [Tepidisphaeraceae bacterium]